MPSRLRKRQTPFLSDHPRFSNFGYPFQGQGLRSAKRGHARWQTGKHLGQGSADLRTLSHHHPRRVLEWSWHYLGIGHSRYRVFLWMDYLGSHYNTGYLGSYHCEWNEWIGARLTNGFRWMRYAFRLGINW